MAMGTFFFVVFDNFSGLVVLEFLILVAGLMVVELAVVGLVVAVGLTVGVAGLVLVGLFVV